jgi:hypothetical protein
MRGPRSLRFVDAMWLECLLQSALQPPPTGHKLKLLDLPESRRWPVQPDRPTQSESERRRTTGARGTHSAEP